MHILENYGTYCAIYFHIVLILSFRRPTWLPRLRTMAVDARDWIESDPKKNGLLSYLYALSDIAAPKSCIKILEDDDRHSWYLGCFQECFKCPKRALVVGAGGGMLGMLAAQAGCQRVTQVERSRMLYRMAKQIIESNKHKDYTKDVNLVSGILESVRVELTEVQDLKQETSLQYSLPKESQIKDYYFMEQPAEVLITDLIDHTVLGLHLLPAVDYSAKYLLTPGAQVIPGTVKIMAQIIELKLDDIAGFDLSAMDCYRWYPGDEKFDAQNNPYKPLSDPFVAVEINLTKRVELVQSGGGACKDELWEVDEDINVLVTETGQWNAVLFWFELGMDHGPNSVKLTNHHKSDCNRVNGSSWGQAVQYLDDRQVSQGQELLVRVQQDKSQIIFSSTPPQCRMHHAIVPRWHYDMILDAERNAAYNTAIQKAVAAKKSFKSGSKVHCLDMGAGSGLLSMMAARAGADYTYAAEMNAHMCDVAEECTIMNGFLDKILVLDRDVRRMDVLRKSDGTAPELERPVDIAIFEVFDSGLIGEGVLHILAAAKAKLLMPDASLVPCRAEVYAQPIQMRLSNSHGLDIQQANRWRWRSDYEGVELGRNKDHWVPLAEPSKVFSFDFYDVQQCAMDNQNILTFDITTEGVCNAVAMWFKLHLDDEISLSTSPYEEKGPTWQQAVQYIKEVKLEKGDQIQVQATHDTYSISYKLVEDKNVLEKMTSVPLYDEQWKTSFDSLESFNSQIVKSCVQNPLEFRFVAQTSIQFAARPHDFGLDASSSSEFCSRFMG